MTFSLHILGSAGVVALCRVECPDVLCREWCRSGICRSALLVATCGGSSGILAGFPVLAGGFVCTGGVWRRSVAAAKRMGKCTWNKLRQPNAAGRRLNECANKQENGKHLKCK